MELEINLVQSEFDLNTDEEIAAKIGTNPLILKRILKNLPDDQLLYYRHVNSLWNDVSSKTLILRESIEILFSCSETPKNLIHKKGNLSLTLPKLTFLLKNSKKFPCVEFHFYGLHLDDPQLSPFLLLQGPKIKSLWLSIKIPRTRRRHRSFFYDPDNNVNLGQDEDLDSDSDSDSSSSDEEEDLNGSDENEFLSFQKLIEKVPHLESLSLHGILSSWELHLQKNSSLSLKIPSLKSLQADLRAHPQLTRVILKATPNLVRFEQPLSMEDDEDFIKIFLTSRVNVNVSVGVIQVLSAYPNKSNFEFYEKFAEASPHLREIKVELSHQVKLTSKEEGFRRACGALYKILESSQSTLNIVKISMASRRDKFPSIYWPTLTRVKSLFVDLWKCPENEDSEEEQEEFFEPQEELKGRDWTDIFPSLHELFWDEDLCSDYFPFLKSAPTVRCLQLMRQTSPKIIQRLPIIFSNLEKLSMKDIQDFSRISDGVWKFLQLKSLYLGIDVDRDCPGNSFPNLDAAFTGIDPEVCQLLINQNYQKNFDTLDCKNVEHLRVNSSIVDLKCLRVLGMRFYDFDMEKKESYNFLTRLTGRYAIQMIPQLTVDAYCKSSFSKENAARMVRCVKEGVDLNSACITGYPIMEHGHLRTMSNQSDSDQMD